MSIANQIKSLLIFYRMNEHFEIFMMIEFVKFAYLNLRIEFDTQKAHFKQVFFLLIHDFLYSDFFWHSNSEYFPKFYKKNILIHRYL